MLEYISGKVAELNPAFAVLDNHGIGYMLNISLTTYDELNAKLARNNDEPQRLYVHEAIREDAHLLFGFYTKRERELFLLLISVSGVGPNTARVILSSLNPADLEQAIAAENVAALKAVKGIGAKTAQRIIVDLRDKIKVASVTLLENSDANAGGASHAMDEALAALVMLGFPQAASLKALKQLFKNNPATTAEQAIKQALKML
ncbi:MAG: Holliday junction branch migration protein RuvA [Muribaculaceae bacterium]|nr:Holliday junction branch migration protein RuvA [Muribaculaceae bacterium]